MTVESDATPGLLDRQLDPPSRPAVILRDEIELYQQIVVNPLLTVIGWLLIRAAVTPPFSRWLAIPLEVTIAACFLPLFVLQFHCLDCGTTGWLRHRHRHACAGVLDRRRLRQTGRRFFSPDVQARVWFWLLVLGFLGYLIVIT